MNWVYFGILPESPLSTPLTADTLWGHICWYIRESRGESALKEFIHRFQSDPPFLLSDAFPFEFIPFPLIPITNRVESEIIKAQLPDSTADKRKKLFLFNKLKKLKKARFIPYQRLSKIAQEFDILKLFNELLATEEIEKPPKSYTIIEPHVSIDRLTLTAKEGQLFFTSSEVYEKSDSPSQWIIALIRDFDESELFRYLKEIGNIGYGADRSVGRGRFEVEAPKPLAPQPLREANLGIALSHFVPAQNDPISGYWNLSTKFGRVGGIFSIKHPLSDIPFTPFKRPLIMLTPGSVFRITYNFAEKPFWGRLVSNIHRIAEVVHFGYAPIFPLNAKPETLTE